jgi:hypothetical protein
MAAVAADSTICHAVRFTSNESIVWFDADVLPLGCRSDGRNYELDVFDQHLLLGVKQHLKTACAWKEWKYIMAAFVACRNRSHIGDGAAWPPGADEAKSFRA